MKIIRKKSLDSTNTYAEKLINDGDISGPCCITTAFQQVGKGQGTNTWESESGKNLTFSLVCFPGFLRAEKQFQLNEAVALSVLDFIRSLLPEKDISIKWPNDIYIENKKVAGILIEVSVQKEMLKHAIIGIGININQEEFPETLPNPCSVIQFSGAITDLDTALDKYLKVFEHYYEMLEQGNPELLESKYLESLYRFGQRSAFEFEGNRIHACICGVNEYGWLQLVKDDGTMLCRDMGTIKMVME